MKVSDLQGVTGRKETLHVIALGGRISQLGFGCRNHSFGQLPCPEPLTKIVIKEMPSLPINILHCERHPGVAGQCLLDRDTMKRRVFELLNQRTRKRDAERYDGAIKSGTMKGNE